MRLGWPGDEAGVAGRRGWGTKLDCQWMKQGWPGDKARGEAGGRGWGGWGTRLGWPGDEAGVARG